MPRFSHYFWVLPKALLITLGFCLKNWPKSTTTLRWDAEVGLGERPIFHHKEGRVEAHIFLCMLSYHLLISIEKTLLNAGVHTSWETVRETLKTHQINTIVLPTDGGMVLRIRQGTSPEAAHQDLYKKLRISSEIIRPHKTWSTAKEGSR